MHRSLIFLLITACSSLPAPATSQVAQGDDAPRTIHVDATATVERAPDRAVIQLAVITMAANAGDASSQNAATMERVIAAVRRVGIPQADIRTLRIELSPRYERSRENQEPRITGYQAMNQVVVTVDSVPRVGPVVDAAVEAGANRVTGIHFELREPRAAHHEALRRAIEMAREEAGVIAAALGEPLGPPLQVTTSAYRPVPMYARGAMAMGDVAELQVETPVEPGEIQVQATVTITFRIGS